MSRKLQWPEDRGTFVDRDPDRTPDPEGIREVAPGEVIRVDDDDTADHYLDRGFQPAPDEPVTAEVADDEPTSWDQFQAMGYEERQAAVGRGDVDHLLERAFEEDRSKNVQDAVQDRAAEVGVDLPEAGPAEEPDSEPEPDADDGDGDGDGGGSDEGDGDGEGPEDGDTPDEGEDGDGG